MSNTPKGLDILTLILETKGLNQSDIATLLGITRASVSSWRKVGVPMKHADRLCTLFNIPAQTLARAYGFKV